MKVGSVKPEDRRTVISAIDEMKNEIVDLCSKVIQVSSVNPDLPGVVRDEVIGGETECNQFLADTLGGWGFKTDLWEALPQRHNLVATLRGSGDGNSLILNGHIDTVTHGDTKHWRLSPTSGAVVGGRIFGRGASDMKSGIVAMAMALHAVQKAGFNPKGDVFLESVVGEETMQPGTIETIKRGYTAKAAVVTEPTGSVGPLRLNPVHGGALHLSITLKGKATHTCMRYEIVHAGGKGSQVGVNAIEKGVKILVALQELEREWGISKRHSLLPPGHASLNPGLFIGGGIISPESKQLIPYVIPDYCTLEYVIWYPPQAKVKDVQREVIDYIKKVCQTDPWLRKNPPVYAWKLCWPSFTTPTDHPIVKTVSAAHEMTQGRPAQLEGFLAVCDAAFLSRAKIPSVVYGPGSVSEAHSVNESVGVKEVIDATKTLALTTMMWCGYST